MNGDSNLKAENIRKGVSIFGVSGSYEPKLEIALSGGGFEFCDWYNSKGHPSGWKLSYEFWDGYPVITWWKIGMHNSEEDGRWSMQTAWCPFFVSREKFDFDRYNTIKVVTRLQSHSSRSQSASGSYTPWRFRDYIVGLFDKDAYLSQSSSWTWQYGFRSEWFYPQGCAPGFRENEIPDWVVRIGNSEHETTDLYKLKHTTGKHYLMVDAQWWYYETVFPRSIELLNT